MKKMAEHTFDATITLIYEPAAGDPGKRHAADTILEIASEYGMAVSLHDEGTLNVKELSSKLPSWRNVATDPPQLGKYVLCYFVGGHVCSCAYAQETYDSEPRWYSDFSARMGQLPTHWMPLPEAPNASP